MDDKLAEYSASACNMNQSSVKIIEIIIRYYNNN